MLKATARLHKPGSYKSIRVTQVVLQGYDKSPCAPHVTESIGCDGQGGLSSTSVWTRTSFILWVRTADFPEAAVA